MPFSILILTKNEEINITQCIESLEGADDVVVLDSFSTDRTVACAEACGARVVQRGFDNWAAHQNWAVVNIRFKHDWVFYLDADERLTAALRAELEELSCAGGSKNVAYFCGRDNYFMGRKIGRCYPPVPILRFFRPERVRWERLVNPVAVVDGPIGHIKNRFLHYNFSKGLEEWFEKHNRYSTAEAMEGMKLLGASRMRLREVLATDRVVRRNALKRLSFRMPFRGGLKFVYLYFFRLGVLDGYPGFIYCSLQAIYETMIAVKMVELRRRSIGLFI